MTKDRMLEISRELLKRWLILHEECSSCLPDDYIEYINQVIELIKNNIEG